MTEKACGCVVAANFIHRNIFSMSHLSIALVVFFVLLHLVIFFSHLFPFTSSSSFFFLCKMLWDLLMMKDYTNKWLAEFLQVLYLKHFCQTPSANMTLYALSLTAGPPKLQKGMDVQTEREWRGKALQSWTPYSSQKSYLPLPAPTSSLRS